MGNKKMEEKLIKKSHLLFCFESIVKYIRNKKLPEYPKELEDKKYSLFVTWKIGEEKELRGCIGTFQQEFLSKNLQKYALISAFQDTRFEPIREEELENLHLSLSFLYNY